jgi:MraZ protein
VGRFGVEWEAMLLTGTFNRVLDDKLRIAIPAPLRDALACPAGCGLFVTPGTDQSLTLYTEAAFQALGDRLAQTPPTRTDVRAFSRLFYGQAQYAELDGHGRIRIPQELASLAKLQKEVVLVGVQDHLEIWAVDVWRNYVADKQSHFDEIAESALSGETTTRYPSRTA